ncbi:lamin tail domain-containing protein [Aureibacter tunicatorum]|uniref:LTD domain-containing protein n=1 Tax=Aureibacter tunicatorum TaxID=866807 RepID=A0AAE3XL54_9BACT|nr:lamin tail domain-containing protein [Aureibacter tunicatorum]MDR6237945.1 hypothetical protein [Aureibacter tunicatorum]
MKFALIAIFFMNIFQEASCMYYFDFESRNLELFYIHQLNNEKSDIDTLLLISELMVDPSPSVELPNVEYIEIFNPNEFSVNTIDFTIADLSKEVKLKEFILEPQEYLLLVKEGHVEMFSESMNVMGLSSWASLNNSSDEIKLKNRQEVLLDRIEYDLSYYQDSEKSKGGWSLERINPDWKCYDKRMNWRGSEAPAGGTPGLENSIGNSDWHGELPRLERIALNDSLMVLGFDIPVDATRFKVFVDGTAINDGVWSIDQKSWTLVGEWEERKYQLTVSDYSNCNGISRSDTTVVLELDKTLPVYIGGEFVNPNVVRLKFDEIIKDEELKVIGESNEEMEIVFQGQAIELISEDAFVNDSLYRFKLIGLSDLSGNKVDTLEVNVLAQSEFVSSLVHDERVVDLVFDIELGSLDSVEIYVEGIGRADIFYLLDDKVLRLFLPEGIKKNIICPVSIRNLKSLQGELISSFDAYLHWDTRKASLLRAYILNDFQINLEFNEKLNEESLHLGSFELGTGLFPTEFVSLFHDELFTIELSFDHQFQSDSAYQLSLHDLPDMQGNLLNKKVLLKYDTVAPILDAYFYKPTSNILKLVFDDLIAEVEVVRVDGKEIPFLVRNNILMAQDSVNEFDLDIIGMKDFNGNKHDSVRYLLGLENEIGQDIYFLNDQSVFLETDYQNYNVEQCGVSEGDIVKGGVIFSACESFEELELVEFKGEIDFDLYYDDYLSKVEWFDQMVKISFDGEILNDSVGVKIEGADLTWQSWNDDQLYVGFENVGDTVWLSVSRLEGSYFQKLPDFSKRYIREIQDTLPPSVIRYEVLSANELLLEFNEEVEKFSSIVTSYFAVNKNKPVKIERESSKRLRIVIEGEFDDWNVLEITGVRDLRGNEIHERKIEFAYRRVRNPKIGDLLLTELMISPEKDGVFPFEYVELFNASDQTIDLQNVILSDESSSVQLPKDSLLSGEYAVFCKGDCRDGFSKDAKVIELLAMPSMNNGGDVISISVDGSILDEIDYSIDYYLDVIQEGFGLEKDMQFHCSQYGWGVSRSELKGTPGMRNSIEGLIDEFDQSELDVLVELKSETLIKMSFNKPYKEVDIDEMGFQKGSVLNAEPIDDFSIEFTLEHELESDRLYSFELDGVSWCHQLKNARPVKVLKPSGGLVNLKLSEILFDPVQDCEDFIEIFNVSDSKWVDLTNLSVRKELFGDSGFNVPDYGKYLAPRSYLWFSSDVQCNLELYSNAESDNAVEVKSLPNFVNEQGSVYLVDASNGFVVDSLVYDVEVQSFSHIDDVEGFSLERRSFDDSLASDVWKMSSESSGGATPGKENSVYIDAVDSDLQFYLSSNVLIPESEEYSELEIYMDFHEPFVGKVEVLDAYGRLVHEIHSNMSFGVKSVLSWNGYGNKGRSLKEGLYILRLERDLGQGNKEEYFKSFAIGWKD